MLTQAAVSGAQDTLLGLKENVIIGRLIPARVQIPGMDKLLHPDPIPELAGIAPGGWLGIGGETPGINPMGMEGGAHGTPDDDFFGKDDGLEEDEGGLVNGAGFLSTQPDNGAAGNGGQGLNGGDGINLNPETSGDYNPFARQEDEPAE